MSSQEYFEYYSIPPITDRDMNQMTVSQLTDKQENSSAAHNLALRGDDSLWNWI
jgi:hypothetical protein